MSIYVVVEDNYDLGKSRLVGAYFSKSAALEACLTSTVPRHMETVPIMDEQNIIKPRFDPPNPPITTIPNLFNYKPAMPIDPFASRFTSSKYNQDSKYYFDSGL